MDLFLKTVPGIITLVGVVVGAIVVGGLAIYGTFDKAREARKKVDDAADDRLIKLLQTTVDELTKKVNTQDDVIDELTKKVIRVEEKNKTLVEVLQGRDSQTLEFYKKAFEMMDVEKQTNAIVTKLAEGQAEMMKLMNGHLRSMENITTSAVNKI